MVNQFFFKKLQMSSDVTGWYYVAVGREECPIEWWEELNISQNSVNWEGSVSYLKWVGKYFKRIKVTPRPPLSYLKESQCVKSIHIRSYSGPYSVRMRGNEEQNNFEYEHFSRSE